MSGCSGHRSGDVGEHVFHLCADRTHGGDRSNGNQRGDQDVLDGGGALFALHQTTENGQHWVSPKKKNVLLTFTGAPACRPTVLGTNDATDRTLERLCVPDLIKWLRSDA